MKLKLRKIGGLIEWKIILNSMPTLIDLDGGNAF